MNILIIDDHPIIVQAYISCFSDKKFVDEVPTFSIARNCQEGFAIIEKLIDELYFDLAIIDQRLPVYHEKNIFCGADLALLLKAKNPTCKIIIITSHSEVITIYNLFKKVSPSGLIIKNDVDTESLYEGVKQVLAGNVFHSSSVKKVLQEILKKELMVDDINRQILVYLSKGYRIRDIEEMVSLTISPIQRRIAQMKDAFNVNEDSSLVKEAIIQGFL